MKGNSFAFVFKKTYKKFGARKKKSQLTANKYFQVSQQSTFYKTNSIAWWLGFWWKRKWWFVMGKLKQQKKNNSAKILFFSASSLFHRELNKNKKTDVKRWRLWYRVRRQCYYLRKFITSKWEKPVMCELVLIFGIEISNGSYRFLFSEMIWIFWIFFHRWIFSSKVLCKQIYFFFLKDHNG